MGDELRAKALTAAQHAIAEHTAANEADAVYAQ
jgi:hypothetical protein